MPRQLAPAGHNHVEATMSDAVLDLVKAVAVIALLLGFLSVTGLVSW